MNLYELNEQDYADAQKDETGGMAVIVLGVIAGALVLGCWAFASTMAAA
jgi:hypothetical protein